MTIDPRLENTAATGRRVNLVDARGRVSNVDERDALTFVDSGKYNIATEADVRGAIAAGTADTSTMEQVAAFGVSAARGGIDAILALPKGISALGSMALGVDDPLSEIGGAQVVSDVAGIASELGSSFETIRPGTSGGITAEAGKRRTEQEMRRLARDNPLATTVGRVGGELAGLAASGGLGAGVGLGARALAATGSRALGLAATGAAEGALLGVGAASEKAFIGDEKLTSEKVLASIGMGALLGAGGGVALGGLGAGIGFAGRSARQAVSKLATRAGAADGILGSGEPIRDMARGWAVKALGFKGQDLRKLAPKGASSDQIERQIAKIADEAEGLLSKTGDTAETAANVAKAHSAAGAKLGEIRKSVDDLITKGDEAVAPSSQAIQEEIRTKVLQQAIDNPDQLARRKVERDVTRLLDDVAKLGPNPTTSQLSKLRKSYWENQILENTMGIKQPKIGTEHIQQVARILEDHATAAIEKGALKLGTDTAEQYTKAKLTYHALSQAQTALGKETARQAGNRFFSLTDTIAASGGLAGNLATGGAGIGSAITGGIVGAAHKMLRERGPAVFANQLFKLSRKLDGKVNTSLDSFFKVAAGEPAKFKPTKAMLDAASLGVSPSMALFMGGSKNPQLAYEKRVKELQEATANFGGGVRTNMQERFGALREHAPGVYAQMTLTGTVAAEFLKSKAPSPLFDAMNMTPRSVKPIPSDIELAEFARYYSAVADPHSVLEDLQRGMATHEQIEALKTVYPKFYQNLQMETLGKIRAADMAGKPINFRARQQLSLLLDLGDAGDPLLSAEFADRVAQADAMRRPPKQPPTGGGGGATGYAERMTTTSQELTNG